MIPVAKPLIGEAEKNKVIEVLESGMLASGAYVEEFERQFAGYLGAKAAVATSNGTTALHTALAALGLGEGDEIITTPFTFAATANSILYVGARPLFADVDYTTFNIDPASVEKVIKKHPQAKALTIVHLYGLPCDMDAMHQLTKKYGILLIEDCAQAHGAAYHGRKVGTFGAVGMFSFYPTKNITTGEGGMVVSNQEDVIKTARMLINHGQSKRYTHEILGYNFRMTNIQAGLGICQLARLEDFNARRIQTAAIYDAHFGDLDWLETPVVPPGCRHVYHQYTVKLKTDRAKFLAYLEAKGIGYGIHYPIPLNAQPLYKKRGFTDDPCPVAEKLSQCVVSLPVHPGLTDEDVNYIITTVRAYKP